MAMDNEELISMLNHDLADEHAAINRYLIHAYQEGEDTPMGAGLLSRSREEMWHMHWLGMIICRMGGEPVLTPAPYPFDPANRTTMLKSYVEYEKRLIPHYNAEAEEVADPHIKRVLQREAWESAIHARRFERMLDKLSLEDAKSAPGGGISELPAAFMEMLQTELAAKYTEMWQHIRIAWVFQKEVALGWGLMDQAMEKMKHLALFTEAVAVDSAVPRLEIKIGEIDKSRAMGLALQRALEDADKSRTRHLKLQTDKEFVKHSGLVIKLDLEVRQEAYQADEIKDWLKKMK